MKMKNGMKEKGNSVLLSRLSYWGLKGLKGRKGKKREEKGQMLCTIME